MKQHVEDLKNASQIFAKADAAEKKAHADYDVAKKAADEAAQELAKLAPAKKAADAKVAAAQAAYDEALARLREAKDRLAAAKRALAALTGLEFMLSETMPKKTVMRMVNIVLFFFMC